MSGQTLTLFPRRQHHTAQLLMCIFESPDSPCISTPSAQTDLKRWSFLNKCWLYSSVTGCYQQAARIDSLLVKPGPFVRCLQNDWFTIKWFLVGACRWNWCGSIPGALTNQLFKLAGRVLSDRHGATIIFPLRLQINLFCCAGLCDNLRQP